MEIPHISSKFNSEGIIKLFEIIALPNEELLFAENGSTAIGFNEYKNEFELTNDQETSISTIKRAFIATNIRLIAINRKKGLCRIPHR